MKPRKRRAAWQSRGRITNPSARAHAASSSRCLHDTSRTWVCSRSRSKSASSNRLVRTRMPGGVAGARPSRENVRAAPMPITAPWAPGTFAAVYPDRTWVTMSPWAAGTFAAVSPRRIWVTMSPWAPGPFACDFTGGISTSMPPEGSGPFAAVSPGRTWVTMRDKPQAFARRSVAERPRRSPGLSHHRHSTH